MLIEVLHCAMELGGMTETLQLQHFLSTMGRLQQFSQPELRDLLPNLAVNPVYTLRV